MPKTSKYSKICKCTVMYALNLVISKRIFITPNIKSKIDMQMHTFFIHYKKSYKNKRFTLSKIPTYIYTGRNVLYKCEIFYQINFNSLNKTHLSRDGETFSSVSECKYFEYRSQ